MIAGYDSWSDNLSIAYAAAYFILSINHAHLTSYPTLITNHP